MNNIRKTAIFLLLVFAGLYSCKEGDRFEISSDDKTPPSAPVLDSVQSLPGGARIFYKIPADEDVISIEASYTSKTGKIVKSAVSFYAKSLDVLGFADTEGHTVQLYALDRAGNKSTMVDVLVKPLKPAFMKVAESLTVKPAFTALMVDWKNELQQSINVYVDLSYSLNGSPRTVRQAFSSKKLTDKQFIRNLDIPETEPVSVHFSVADAYGNETESKDLGKLYVKRDEMLDKSLWVLPEVGDVIGKDTTGQPVFMSDGNNYEGRNEHLRDGIIENTGLIFTINAAFFDRTRTVTKVVDGISYTKDVNHNPKFNFIIDLGGYYEISRIVTHQNWSYDILDRMRVDNIGRLYGLYNIGIYNVYRLDEKGTADKSDDVWVLINQTKIPMPPSDYSDMEKILYAAKGDEAFMYPDDPEFTPRTRYFRYEAVKGFQYNYSDDVAYAISEITLYGRKAQ